MIKKGMFGLGIALISGAVVGCGGGGSGSDSEPACRSYCGSACQRTADCGYFGQAGVRSCTDTCIVTTRDSANSEAKCSRAEEVIRDATCADLALILNLRMYEPKLSTESEVNSDQVEPAGFSEHIGYELGICDIEDLEEGLGLSNP